MTDSKYIPYQNCAPETFTPVPSGTVLISGPDNRFRLLPICGYAREPRTTANLSPPMMPVVLKDGLLMACTASDGKVAVRSDIVALLTVVEPAAISGGVYTPPSFCFKSAAPAKPQKVTQRKHSPKQKVAP